MVSSIDQFGKALVGSGLLSADELKAAWSAIAVAERPKDGPGLAALLIRQGKLTEFQAQGLISGGGMRLVLGDYELLARIGAGGMGQVYKARHRRMERVVALKVMSTAAMKDEGAVKRFQREVRAAARLEHPNIVTAYDSGESGNIQYLVMQLVDGGDLADLVKRQGPLGIDQAVAYVVQAARGLAYAHDEGVVHRDIKPANLLVDKKGVVKILDMGLARIESVDDGLTATEQVMGTVDYMSPEQASNTKSADARSDIYALGCTLWYLLTGKRAYDGDTVVMRLMAHRDGPLPSLVKTRDDAPWALEQVLHKMLAKRAADRYQAMEEVVTALAPFCGSWPTAGGGASASGAGSAPNAELSAFLKTIGPSARSPATSAQGGGSGATDPALDATARFESPRGMPESADGSPCATGGARSVAAGQATTGKKGAASPSAGTKRTPVAIAAAVVAIAAAVVAVAGIGGWMMLGRDGVDRSGEHSPRAPIAGSPPAVDPSTTATVDFALQPDYDPAKEGAACVELPRFLRPSDVMTIEMTVTARSHAPAGESRPLWSLGGRLELKQYADRWVFQHNNPDGEPKIEQVTTPITSLGKPTHLAASSTGTEMRLFVDGKLTGTTALANPLPSTMHVPMSLGRSGGGKANYGPLDGTFDEIRISRNARYTADYRPKSRLTAQSDTAALYHCDQGAGTTLTDDSGKEQHGTITGATWVKADAAASGPPATPTATPAGSSAPTEKRTDEPRYLAGHEGVVRQVLACPDGEHAISTGWDNTWRRWHLPTGVQVVRVDAHPNNSNCAALSPDGKLVATGGSSYDVKLWDAATGIEKRKFYVPESSSISRLTFSPDGRRLLVGGFKGLLRLYDVESKGAPIAYSGHTEGINGLIFLPGGEEFVTTSHDKTVRLWNVDPNKPARLLTEFKTPSGPLAVSPDGRRLAIGRQSAVDVWSLREHALEATLRAGNTSVDSLQFFPDSRHVAAGLQAETIRVWDVTTRQVAHDFVDTTQATNNIAITPDGRSIVAGGGYTIINKLEADGDYRLRVWNVPAAVLGETPAETKP